MSVLNGNVSLVEVYTRANEKQTFQIVSAAMIKKQKGEGRQL